MSDRFELSPTTPDDPNTTMVAIWRRAATEVRRQADEVTDLVGVLAAHHRPDVWQGAVATRFGEELEHWRSRLGSDLDTGLGAELREVADRLDARALFAEQDAVIDIWVRAAPSADGP